MFKMMVLLPWNYWVTETILQRTFIHWIYLTVIHSFKVDHTWFHSHKSKIPRQKTLVLWWCDVITWRDLHQPILHGDRCIKDYHKSLLLWLQLHILLNYPNYLVPHNFPVPFYILELLTWLCFILLADLKSNNNIIRCDEHYFSSGFCVSFHFISWFCGQ